MKNLSLLFSFALLMLQLVTTKAQQPELVADVNTEPAEIKDPSNLFGYNGILLFSITHEMKGTELWKSDGTNDGTIMLKDINSTGSHSSAPYGFLLVNGHAFYIG